MIIIGAATPPRSRRVPRPVSGNGTADIAPSGFRLLKKSDSTLNYYIGNLSVVPFQAECKTDFLLLSRFFVLFLNMNIIVK